MKVRAHTGLSTRQRRRQRRRVGARRTREEVPSLLDVAQLGAGFVGRAELTQAVHGQRRRDAHARLLGALDDVVVADELRDRDMGCGSGGGM